MPCSASTEVDADGDDGNEDNNKFSELPPVPPNLPVFESPPPPGEDIHVDSDPNVPWDDILMCLNTPTKCASSSEVWWPTGPMRRLAPKHPKRCDKDYTQIYFSMLEGTYEGLVFNEPSKLLKE